MTLARYAPFWLLFALATFSLTVSDRPPLVKGEPLNGADTAWMLTATALVLFMTPGLSFFYGGMVRARNVISTMLQSFICLGVISLLWVVVGFSLCFGESLDGFIGDPRTFFMYRGVGAETHPDLSPTVPLLLFSLFQLKFAVITPALITGSFAERVRFSSYLIFISLFTLFVYAPLAHWTWHPHGFLKLWGVLDFAGGTVVHMSAGIAALSGSRVFGRRKVHLDNIVHAPANLPYVMLGTGMLWFGWFGFNAGSALAASDVAVKAFATTNSASAAAMLSWIFFDTMRGRKPSSLGACVGAVVGLVAITPAAGYVSVPHGIVIGVFAAIISNIAVHWKTKSNLDDTLDVFPCHGVGGIVGMLATGMLAKDVGLINGVTHTMLAHLWGLVIAILYCFGMSLILYRVTNFILPMRVSEADEEIGLDLSQHGEQLEHH